MDTSILEDIGLTNAEIKVYLCLLESGPCMAGIVIEKTGLQNSVVHMTLHKLLGKGFVSYIKKNSFRTYQAADPTTIVDLIEEKKKKFQEILPQLLAKQTRHEKEEAVVYEGFKGLKTALYDLIKDAKRGEEYLYFAFDPEDLEKSDYLFKFYKDFEKERKRRGIVIKGLAPARTKEKFKERDIKAVKFVDFPIPSNLIIFNNTIVLNSWDKIEDGKTTFVIHSKQTADSFKEFFYSIWDKK